MAYFILFIVMIRHEESFVDTARLLERNGPDRLGVNYKCEVSIFVGGKLIEKKKQYCVRKNGFAKFVEQTGDSEIVMVYNNKYSFYASKKNDKWLLNDVETGSPGKRIVTEVNNKFFEMQCSNSVIDYQESLLEQLQKGKLVINKLSINNSTVVADCDYFQDRHGKKYKYSGVIEFARDNLHSINFVRLAYSGDEPVQKGMPYCFERVIEYEKNLKIGDYHPINKLTTCVYWNKASFDNRKPGTKTVHDMFGESSASVAIDTENFFLTKYGLPEPSLSSGTYSPAGLPWFVYIAAIGVLFILLAIFLQKHFRASQT